MPAQSSSNRAFAVLAIALIAGLSAYLLYPALLLDRSLVHGDNVHHGYSLMKFHHDVIHNGVSPLWTNLIYGGHALFAEGQAGLSNPFQYLVAWLFPPEYGHNLIHWLAMTAFGLGCFGLCRSLSISPVGAIFGALAAAFSSLTIHTNTNMTAIAAMVWVPWTMWAFERWLRRPDPLRAILFGLSTAMLVFSGYPHFLHGTVIYMLASACTVFQGGPLREVLPRTVNTYWRTALVAVAVCVAISAIQWLPLLEMATLSHRKEGVGIAINGTPEFMIRGLLYSTDNFATTDTPNTDYFPNTGSLLVCMLASLSLLAASSARIKGHIVATFLLLNLGLGSLSPVYRVVTSYGLIPGIDSFRMMFPYFVMSIIGTAVLAGSALDSLGRISGSRPFSASPARWAGLGLIVAFWGYVILRFHTEAAPVANYAFPGLGLAGLAALVASGRARLFPLYACALLLAEISLLKLAPFGTVETSVLTRQPAAARHINSREDSELFKHVQLGMVPLTFTNPNSALLERRTRQELNHLVASTNLLWDIPSFSGALALKSYRKPMANDVVTQEVQGSGDHKPGARLMDVLSIKWVSKSLPGASTSRHLVSVTNARDQHVIWENPHALPLIQTYPRASFVAGAQQALEALQDGAALRLYVEADPAVVADIPQADASENINLQTVSMSPTRYRFASNSPAGYWLFMADTYYPGWQAFIDEEETPLYPAQLLGKALFVPAGQHRIKIRFRSESVRLGALVSGFALLCLIVYLSVAALRRMRPRQHH